MPRPPFSYKRKKTVEQPDRKPTPPVVVVKPVEPAQPAAAWRTSAAHLLLLSKFATPRAIDDFGRDELWHSVLHEPADQAIRQFIDAGVIVAATTAELLDYKLRVAELKRQLRTRNLADCGAKTELIERIMAADPSWVQQHTAGMSVFTCTDEGRAIAEKYHDQRKAQRSACEKDVRAALAKGDFGAAAQAVYTFEAAQVFPRGIGIDWRHQDSAQDESALRAISTCNLKMLSALTHEQLEQVRLNAGVRWLFAYSYDDYPPPAEITDHLPDDGFRLTNAVISNARFHSVIDACRRSQAQFPQARHAIIYTHGNDFLVCDECRKLAEREWPLDEAPELPYEKCTSSSESGCRCEANWQFKAD
ncbi:MAG: SAP domain-containing protein [Chloroflexi bacterium]|nr:SAP domain-containing protein [Chloroflexota bacterium]